MELALELHPAHPVILNLLCIAPWTILKTPASQDIAMDPLLTWDGYSDFI